MYNVYGIVSFLLRSDFVPAWPRIWAAESPKSQVISLDRITIRWLLATSTVDFKGHFDIN